MKGCPAGARRLVFLNQADGPERVRVGLDIARRVAESVFIAGLFLLAVDELIAIARRSPQAAPPTVASS